MKNAGFAIFFFLLLIADLIFLGDDSLILYRFISKPAIPISLLIYLWFSGLRKGQLKYGLSIGLILFMAGNIILLFGESEDMIFIASLMTFLLGQLAYSYAFFHKTYLHHTKFEPLLIGITLYLLLVLYIISASLRHLVPYVLIYMMVIMLFVMIAFIRMPFVSSQSGIRVMTGAMLFVIAATIFSIDKFAYPLAYSKFFIFGSYAVGQFLLITGGIAQGNTEV